MKGAEEEIHICQIHYWIPCGLKIQKCQILTNFLDLIKLGEKKVKI